MKILHLISSSRGSESFSNKLGNSIVDKLLAKHPGATVMEHHLVKSPFPHLEEVHLASFFTPEENRSPEQLEAVRHSDEAIAELLEADRIVIDVPMYNFSIPSTLKAWIDHITRAGITFTYSDNGVEGLVKNKKAYLAISSGGIYSEGVMKDADFTEKYLRFILGFIGITDVEVFRVEGVNMPEFKDHALPKAQKMVQEFAF